MNLKKVVLLGFIISSLLAALFSIGFRMSVKASPDLIAMTATIGGTCSFDVDTGQVVLYTDPSSDLWWEIVSSTERYIVPENGAEFANLGVVDFDSVVNCSIYSLSADPINGSVGNNMIPNGTVLVVKTNIGYYAKMRIDSYGYNLNVTIVYQDDGSSIVGEQTYYIRADGSVEPSAGYISSVDNVTYILSGNIYGSIVVERDNIMVDGTGYRLQGNGTGRGIDLTGTSNVTIKNMEIRAFNSGIWLQESSNASLLENIIANNSYGVWVYASGNVLSGNTIANNSDSGVVIDILSSNNTVSRNTIMNNNRGVWLIFASDNKFYHNNFIDNTQDVDIPASGYANFWDNDVEGNYWNNYTGVDLSGGGNGIGDSPYVIDANNTDRFPLMGPITFFNVGTWNDTAYYIHTVSNSTVSNFNFSKDDMLVSFNVSGLNDTVGFCRVGIPKELLWSEYPEDWTVLVNGTPPVPYGIIENGNYTYIYFTYPHSEKTVEIKGTHVIPEFPSVIILPLFMVATLLAVIAYRRKHSM